MKHLYRIAFTSGFIIAMFTAVVCKGQVSLGVRAGYTIADMEFDGQDRSDYSNVASLTKPVYGLHVDLLFNVPLSYNLYLQPTLRVITKGTKFTPLSHADPVLNDAYVTSGSKLKVSYLEVPVNLVYKQPAGIGRILIGAGPYGAYGLRGKYNYTISRNGSTVTKTSKDIDFSKSSNNTPAVIRVLPWDFGVNGMLGFEFNNNFSISANYGHGFVDIDRNKGTTTKNYYLGFTLGYLFNREDY